MPTCHRIENNRECRYWCKSNWVFCHNYYDGFCRNDVVDNQCVNGWHITEKRYRAQKIAEQLSDDGEAEARSKRFQELSADEVPEAKKCKRDPLLEIYLARFGYKPDKMPGRRDIEHAFLEIAQISPSEFCYEEYSEAFQYIVDIITNGLPE